MKFQGFLWFMFNMFFVLDFCLCLKQNRRTEEKVNPQPRFRVTQTQDEQGFGTHASKEPSWKDQNNMLKTPEFPNLQENYRSTETKVKRNISLPQVKYPKDFGEIDDPRSLSPKMRSDPQFGKEFNRFSKGVGNTRGQKRIDYTKQAQKVDHKRWTQRVDFTRRPKKVYYTRRPPRVDFPRLPQNVDYRRRPPKTDYTRRPQTFGYTRLTQTEDNRPWTQSVGYTLQPSDHQSQSPRKEPEKTPAYKDLTYQPSTITGDQNRRTQQTQKEQGRNVQQKDQDYPVEENDDYNLLHKEDHATKTPKNESDDHSTLPERKEQKRMLQKIALEEPGDIIKKENQTKLLQEKDHKTLPQRVDDQYEPREEKSKLLPTKRYSTSESQIGQENEREIPLERENNKTLLEKEKDPKTLPRKKEEAMAFPQIVEPKISPEEEQRHRLRKESKTGHSQRVEPQKHIQRKEQESLTTEKEDIKIVSQREEHKTTESEWQKRLLRGDGLTELPRREESDRLQQRKDQESFTSQSENLPFSSSESDTGVFSTANNGNANVSRMKPRMTWPITKEKENVNPVTKLVTYSKTKENNSQSNGSTKTNMSKPSHYDITETTNTPPAKVKTVPVSKFVYKSTKEVTDSPPNKTDKHHKGINVTHTNSTPQFPEKQTTDSKTNDIHLSTLTRSTNKKIGNSVRQDIKDSTSQSQSLLVSKSTVSGTTTTGVRSTRSTRRKEISTQKHSQASVPMRNQPVGRTTEQNNPLKSSQDPTSNLPSSSADVSVKTRITSPKSSTKTKSTTRFTQSVSSTLPFNGSSESTEWSYAYEETEAEDTETQSEVRNPDILDNKVTTDSESSTTDQLSMDTQSDDMTDEINAKFDVINEGTDLRNQQPRTTVMPSKVTKPRRRAQERYVTDKKGMETNEQMKTKRTLKEHPPSVTSSTSENVSKVSTKLSTEPSEITEKNLSRTNQSTPPSISTSTMSTTVKTAETISTGTTIPPTSTSAETTTTNPPTSTKLTTMNTKLTTIKTRETPEARKTTLQTPRAAENTSLSSKTMTTSSLDLGTTSDQSSSTQSTMFSPTNESSSPSTQTTLTTLNPTSSSVFQPDTTTAHKTSSSSLKISTSKTISSSSPTSPTMEETTKKVHTTTMTPATNSTSKTTAKTTTAETSKPTGSTSLTATTTSPVTTTQSTTTPTTTTEETETTTILTTTDLPTTQPHIGSNCGEENMEDICPAAIEGSECFDGQCVCDGKHYASDNITCVEYSLGDNEIEIVTSTQNSIEITWPEVEFPDQVPLKYEIAWKVSENLIRGARQITQGSNVPNPRKKVENSAVVDDTSYEIVDLIAGTFYEVAVTVVITKRQSDVRLHFQSLQHRTDTPNAGNLQNFRLDSDGLRVTFEAPDGHYDFCTATASKMDKEGALSLIMQRQQFDCKKLIVSPAEYSTSYTIDVIVTSSKMSSTKTTFNITTFSKAPGYVQELKVINVAGDAADVIWLQPLTPKDYITGYRVTLYADGRCLQNWVTTGTAPETMELGPSQEFEEISQKCGSPSTFNPDMGDDQYKIHLKELEPVKSYTVKVVALNGDTQGQTANVSFITESQVPDTPTDLKARAVSCCEIFVAWRKPKYPGPVTYYVTVEEIGNGDMEPKEITVPGYNNTQTQVFGLKFYTNYSVKLVAKTEAGSSAPVIVEPIQTWEKVSDPVTDLSFQNTTAHSVTLTWSPPKNVHGHLIAYVIFVQRGNFQSECERIVVLSEGKTLKQVNQTYCPNANYVIGEFQHGNVVYTITDLDPWVSYKITVAAYNGLGVGKISNLRVQTQIAAPSVPSSIQCSNPSPGQLTLTWQPPDKKTGPTSYHITVYEAKKPRTTDFGVKLYKNIDNTGYSKTSLTLTGLKDYWFYTFVIFASTEAGSSKDVSPSMPCRTLPAPPLEVEDFKVVPVQNNMKQVAVSWLCPKEENRHGIIEGFSLNQIVENLNRKDLDMNSLPDQNYDIDVKPGECTVHYRKIVTVVPQIEYTFKIRAKVQSVKEEGNALIKSFMAPGTAPPKITSLPSKHPASDNSLNESSFAVTVCASCLLDNSNGEISFFGVLVCQDDYCDKGPNYNQNPKEWYTSLPTWMSAHSNDFQTTYRATGQTWQESIRSEVKDSHREDLFVVGNDTSCYNKPKTDYCNGPVPPGKSFRIRLFSCTLVGCSFSNDSDIFMTAASTSKPSSDGIVIGGAAAGVAVAALVIIIVIIVRVRMRVSKSFQKGKNEQLTQVIALTDMGSQGNANKSRPIAISDFEQMLHKLHADDNALLNQEYVELDKETPIHPMEVGADLDHRQDNRWTNIIPYDHSRVKLKVIPGDEYCSHDYINANYIAGIDSNRDYISTQGPLTRTVPDFWRMVWSQNASVIVMLSNFEELDKRTQMMREKVARYFPDEEESNAYQYGHILVARTGKIDSKGWEIRTLKLTHVKERKNRFVKHFFFKSWTDHAADINPSDLIEFVSVVRDETSSHPHSPLVVHCSAGVGRSGTYIAVDYFYKYINNLKQKMGNRLTDQLGRQTVDIFGRVLSMRDRRRYMVQTKTQYIFIYDTVQELIKRTFCPNPKARQSTCLENVYEDIELTSQPSNKSNNPEDTVYDDVEQLQGQVIVHKKM